MEQYEESVKVYRDLKNVIDTAVKEATGEQVLLIARQLKSSGVSFSIIANSTGLSIDEIDNL